LAQAEEATDYIAAERPATAAKWLDWLMDLVERLPRFPRKGRMVPEVGRSVIREVLYGRYRIIYRVDPTQISIVTVRHQRRRFTADDLERE
jgi:plasmid stabilization system protein ParE